METDRCFSASVCFVKGAALSERRRGVWREVIGRVVGGGQFAAGADRYYAIAARQDYRSIDSMVYAVRSKPFCGQTFTSYDGGYVKPRFE